jgi:hypothetical protein
MLRMKEIIVVSTVTLPTLHGDIFQQWREEKKAMMVARERLCNRANEVVARIQKETGQVMERSEYIKGTQYFITKSEASAIRWRLANSSFPTQWPQGQEKHWNISLSSLRRERALLESATEICEELFLAELKK